MLLRRADSRWAARYAAFASSSGAADSGDSAATDRARTQLYEVSCITCHGANLQGVHEPRPVADRRRRRGRLLPGQHRPDAARAAGRRARRARRRSSTSSRPAHSPPTCSRSAAAPPSRPGTLRGSDATIAEGGELFRLNCASCHGTTGKGAPLSAGKQAPVAEQRDRPADLHGDADRSGEHAGLQRQPAHPGAEAGDRRLHPDAEGHERPGRQRHRPHRAGVRGDRALGRRHRRADGRDPVDRSEDP